MFLWLNRQATFESFKVLGLDMSWTHGFPANPRQLSLCLHAILCATPEDFGAWIGIKCSSFSKMNRGTSMRSPFASMGYWHYPSMEIANAMCERILYRSFRTLYIYTNVFLRGPPVLVHLYFTKWWMLENTLDGFNSTMFEHHPVWEMTICVLSFFYIY